MQLAPDLTILGFQILLQPYWAVIQLLKYNKNLNKKAGYKNYWS